MNFHHKYWSIWSILVISSILSFKCDQMYLCECEIESMDDERYQICDQILSMNNFCSSSSFFLISSFIYMGNCTQGRFHLWTWCWVTGTLLLELGDCQHLEILNLAQNSLTHAVCAGFRELQKSSVGRPELSDMSWLTPYMHNFLSSVYWFWVLVAILCKDVFQSTSSPIVAMLGFLSLQPG